MAKHRIDLSKPKELTVPNDIPADKAHEWLITHAAKSGAFQKVADTLVASAKKAREEAVEKLDEKELYPAEMLNAVQHLSSAVAAVAQITTDAMAEKKVYDLSFVLSNTATILAELMIENWITTCTVLGVPQDKMIVAVGNLVIDMIEAWNNTQVETKDGKEHLKDIQEDLPATSVAHITHDLKAFAYDLARAASLDGLSPEVRDVIETMKKVKSGLKDMDPETFTGIKKLVNKFSGDKVEAEVGVLHARNADELQEIVRRIQSGESPSDIADEQMGKGQTKH